MEPGFSLLLLLIARIVTSCNSEFTLPFLAPAPAPAPQVQEPATHPSEVAILREIPAASWASVVATDPCVPPKSWPGVTCVLKKSSLLPSFYHVSSIHLNGDTSQALSILLSVASKLRYLQSLRITETTSTLPLSSSISIPESVGLLEQLQELDLSNNSVHLGGSIPAQLANLNGLKHLRLPGNELTGAIPETLCKLSSLEYLDLSRNQLQGVVPACLGNVTSLEMLDLGSNRLKSQIPAELGHLSSLVHLNLENNHFEGEVPESLASLASLQTLRCGRNMLRGVLPTQFGTAQSLKVLDFSLNSDISGSIPSSLGNLSDLVAIRLFSMGLNGTIPSDLGKLRNLTELLLHSNSLSGTIPESLSELSKLEVLQLQGNRLSGSLPSSIKRLASLQGLYLQSNSLTGPLPVEITQLQSLSVLNVGFNQLDGVLPEELERMANLEWLLLGSNRFSGQIPSSIGNLRKLRLLDLSNNMFNGSVPSSILGTGLEENLQFNQLDSTGILRRLCFHNECSEKSKPTSDTGSDSISDSFAINAGGPEHNLTSQLSFQADNVCASSSVGFFFANPTCSTKSASWAVSVSGSTASSRIISTSSSVSPFAGGTNSSFVEASQKLYRTARVGGDSITYFGRCLKPGSYVVQLHFVELENSSVDAAGRRVFDVFIQEELVHEKLDIFRITGGPFVPLVMDYRAQVRADSSSLKLELRGTGSWNTSAAGSYNGPIISAIRVFAKTSSNSSDVSSNSRRTRLLGAILGTSIGVLAIICIVLFLTLAWWLRRAKNKALKITDEEQRTGGEEHPIDHLHSFNPDLGPLVTFEYSDLMLATENFSSKCLLGQGAYGKVYKGILQDGKLVAIKQLVHRTPTCRRWFLHELQVISSVRHRNLVPLIGCCIDRGFPLLVCEFMPGGSLHSALFDKESRISLTWERRYQIALDVARGLQYLHEDCAKVKIIHRDVKPGNILLDQELRAHLSDFGIAKFIEQHEDAEVVVSSVMGTRGYLAPEYVINGQLSEKADVYSYGIVLLEIVSGRRGMQSRLNASAPELVSIDEWAWEALGLSQIQALADPRLVDLPIDDIVRLVQISMWCTQGLPELRPSMAQVAAMLVGQLGVPELPSERISWEEFKNVLTLGGSGSTIATSSFWETMNGSYQTANDATLPDSSLGDESSTIERRLGLVAPAPSEELEVSSRTEMVFVENKT